MMVSKNSSISKNPHTQSATSNRQKDFNNAFVEVEILLDLIGIDYKNIQNLKPAVVECLTVYPYISPFLNIVDRVRTINAFYALDQNKQWQVRDFFVTQICSSKESSKKRIDTLFHIVKHPDQLERLTQPGAPLQLPSVLDTLQVGLVDSKLEENQNTTKISDTSFKQKPISVDLIIQKFRQEMVNEFKFTGNIYYKLQGFDIKKLSLYEEALDELVINLGDRNELTPEKRKLLESVSFSTTEINVFINVCKMYFGADQIMRRNDPKLLFHSERFDTYEQLIRHLGQIAITQFYNDLKRNIQKLKKISPVKTQISQQPLDLSEFENNLAEFNNALSNIGIENDFILLFLDAIRKESSIITLLSEPIETDQFVDEFTMLSPEHKDQVRNYLIQHVCVSDEPIKNRIATFINLIENPCEMVALTNPAKIEPKPSIGELKYRIEQLDAKIAQEKSELLSLIDNMLPLSDFISGEAKQLCLGLDTAARTQQDPEEELTNWFLEAAQKLRP